MSDRRGQRDADERQSPGFLQMLSSVAAAFFGVQSRANRERDFTRGKPIHFILMGLGFTAAFVVGLIVVVRIIMAQAGA